MCEYYYHQIELDFEETELLQLDYIRTSLGPPPLKRQHTMIYRAVIVMYNQGYHDTNWGLLYFVVCLLVVLCRDAIEFLSTEGHVYSTIDDEHYKPTDSWALTLAVFLVVSCRLSGVHAEMLQRRWTVLVMMAGHSCIFLLDFSKFVWLLLQQHCFRVSNSHVVWLCLLWNPCCPCAIHYKQIQRRQRASSFLVCQLVYTV